MNGVSAFSEMQLTYRNYLQFTAIYLKLKVGRGIGFNPFEQALFICSGLPGVQEMFKPKIKKKIFEDQIKTLSANEIKEQIMTPSSNKFMKICPHRNNNNLQNPGIKVGITLSRLYNFEAVKPPTSNCLWCRIINEEESNHVKEASTVREQPE